MNIFKKFKVTFNLKSPNKKTKDKEEPEIQCLKYRIHSEFTTDYVFETNPRHLPEKPFTTPTQSRKLQVKSLSENNLTFQAFATETTEEKILDQKKGEVENVLWPSKNEIPKQNESENRNIQNTHRISNIETKNTVEVKQDEKNLVTIPKKEKGILKNKNENTKKEDLYTKKHDNNFSKTNFGYEGEDITYEHYGSSIDDQLGEEDIYYFVQKENENPDQYVVHKSPTVHFAESEHEYEAPIHESENWNENIKNPLYNLSTHPKLNPSFQDINDEEYARSIGLNTFGNTQKLKYPSDYSLEAASIFFDDENEHDC